jgi:hypothetical protein
MSAAESLQERIFRARVEDFLFGLTFPATKAAIIHRARQNNTASQIVEALATLPNQTFESIAAVQAATAYHPPRVWDVEGFPAEAIRHDEIEADRIRTHIDQAERRASPGR